MAYTLDTAVKEILVEVGESNLNKYPRAYQLAVACLRHVNMDLSGIPKVVELTINSNDTVDLPNDYLQYSRIAICDNGVLRSLGLNNNLCLNPNYDDCGDVQRDTSNNVGVDSYIGFGLDYYSDHYRNGELMGRFFGIGGGNNANGYFRIDKASNQIWLAGVNYQVTSIALEYIADIEAIDEDFEVHPFILETVKSYVYWKMIFSNPRIGLGDKQMAEQQYWNNYRLAKQRYAAFTTEEFLAAIRSGNFATIKF